MEQMMENYTATDSTGHHPTLRQRGVPTDAELSKLADSFRSFDFHPKMDEEHIIKTEAGGLCMLVCS